MSDHDLDRCPRCGIERQRTKSEASCGSGYMAVGCFARAEAAEVRVAFLEATVALKNDLLRAYRTSDQRLADRTLTKLASLAKEATA